MVTRSGRAGTARRRLSTQRWRLNATRLNASPLSSDLLFSLPLVSTPAHRRSARHFTSDLLPPIHRRHRSAARFTPSQLRATLATHVGSFRLHSSLCCSLLLTAGSASQRLSPLPQLAAGASSLRCSRRITTCHRWPGSSTQRATRPVSAGITTPVGSPSVGAPLATRPNSSLRAAPLRVSPLATPRAPLLLISGRRCAGPASLTGARRRVFGPCHRWQRSTPPGITLRRFSPQRRPVFALRSSPSHHNASASVFKFTNASITGRRDRPT